MTKSLTGGYEVYPEIGEKERVIFESVMKDHVGVDFKPVAVASQVVDGVNYIFICIGTPVVLHLQTKLYAIRIFTKFENDVSTLEIQGTDEIDVASLVKQSVRNNRTTSQVLCPFSYSVLYKLEQ